ncbi:hypothetical protein FSP39_025293 [Pinctada imbricata]|uniref:RNA-directed RNA polymerase n=1 Tax=Pinctada imbricata TaxID=66713 RepID=A0AA89C865_PINIB|nr:hypothetical protein FSP39_025293 [Pinctada imbricata]
MPFDGIEKTVVVDRHSDREFLVISLKHNPLIVMSRDTDRNYPDETRLVSLDLLGVQTLGRVSALCLEISDQNSKGSSLGLLSTLRANGFRIVYSHIVTYPFKSVDLTVFERNLPSNFELRYAWNCLVSKGFKITDAILMREDKILQLIALNERNLSAQLFHDMSVEADGDILFDFQSTFESCLKELQTGSKVGLSIQNRGLYGRVVFTPTDMVIQPPEQVELNRVLRQYKKNNFLRVSLRDENFDKLIEPVPGQYDQILARMRDLLSEGLTVGGTTFYFLGSSNSQLRDHGFWFCTTNNGVSASSIRDNLGDLSQEKCVAKYVARIGLCFSSTSATVDTAKNGCDVQYIPDTERDEFCFTDGIGLMSLTLADQIASSLSLKVTPSAFQIRYGGCKGVIAKNPALGDVNALIIRKSMNKFNSPSTFIETMAHTKPAQLHLNRQIITLMSGLGVTDKVFIDLQETVLSQLANMFIDEKVAVKMLEKSLNMESRETAKATMKFRTLSAKGVTFTNDAFFESLLATIYKTKIGDLMNKSRIEVPASDGRILMGTVDETGLLKYGQVYIQYSEDTNRPQVSTEVVQGTVVIGKNPCFHPGDLRTFEAVDVPDLEHMVDCIVFPQDGPRPHPDEMSGSDLDGDMYHVCWNPDFIPPDCNKPAMDFTGEPALKIDGKITVEHITKYIIDFIRCNMVGKIANAHVVHADKEKNGIFSQNCLALAKLHSDAVDFPKTGVVPEMGKELKVETYPHFMMKKDKQSYKSTKILGKLFDECEDADRLHTKLGESSSSVVEFDEDYRHSVGYERYLTEAKEEKDQYDQQLKEIMDFYGVETEAEAVSGKIQKLRKGQGFVNVDKDDKVEISNQVKQKVLSLRKRFRTNFFQEFKGEDAITDEESKPLIYAKASAWYVVTYNLKRKPDFFSFAWATVGDLLADIKARRIPNKEREMNDPSLHKLGSSILSSKERYQQSWDGFCSKLSKENRSTGASISNILTYVLQILERNQDVIPVFLFTWSWANKNHICSGYMSVFREEQFPLLLLQVMDENGVLQDMTKRPDPSVYSRQSISNSPFSPLARDINMESQNLENNTVKVASCVLKCFEHFDSTKEKVMQSHVFHFYDPVKDGMNSVRISETKYQLLSRRLKASFYQFIHRRSVETPVLEDTVFLPRHREILFDKNEPFICERASQCYDVEVRFSVDKDQMNSNSTIKVNLKGSALDILYVKQRFQKTSTSKALYGDSDRQNLYLRRSIKVSFVGNFISNFFMVLFKDNNIIQFKPLPQRQNAQRTQNERPMNVQHTMRSCLSAIQMDHQHLFHGDIYVMFTIGHVSFKKLNRIRNRMKLDDITSTLSSTHEALLCQQVMNPGKDNIVRLFCPEAVTDNSVAEKCRFLFGEEYDREEMTTFELLLHTGQKLKLSESGDIISLLCPSITWVSHDVIDLDKMVDVRIEVISHRESSPSSILQDSGLNWLFKSNAQTGTLQELDEEYILLQGTFQNKVKAVSKKTEHVYRGRHQRDHIPQSVELVLIKSWSSDMIQDGIVTLADESSVLQIRTKMNDDYEDYVHNESDILQLAEIVKFLQT